MIYVWWGWISEGMAVTAEDGWKGRRELTSHSRLDLGE
jgi:hypothetical protein